MLQSITDSMSRMLDPKTWAWGDLYTRFQYPDLYKLQKAISELCEVPDGTCLSPDGKFLLDWGSLGGESEVFAEEFPQLQIRGDLSSYIAYRGIAGLKLAAIGGNRVVPAYGPHTLIQAVSEAFGMSLEEAAEIFLPSSYRADLGRFPMSKKTVLRRLTNLIDKRLSGA